MLRRIALRPTGRETGEFPARTGGLPMNERFARAGALARVDLGHELDFTLGKVQVRPGRREIVGEAWRETIDLRVMQVLVALARAKGEVVSRDDLIESCWDGVIVGEDTINRCINRMRKVGEASGNAFSIETVPRVGYRLIVPDAAASASEASVSAVSEPVTRRLRIFLSSPGDVTTAREIAAQTIVTCVRGPSAQRAQVTSFGTLPR
jgi:DNA-binding winged helix-turn-helix (wHTH) protein